MMHYHYTRLQSPPLSETELKNRLHVFKEKTRLFVALHQKTPIAFLLCYYTPTTVYFSKLPHNFQARKYQTNSLLCYHGIKHACEQHYRFVEFGITFNDAQARWKSKFKGIQIPINQYQKRFSKTHCLCFDGMHHMQWCFRNRKTLWNDKKSFIQKLINIIK